MWPTVLAGAKECMYGTTCPRPIFSSEDRGPSRCPKAPSELDRVPMWGCRLAVGIRPTVPSPSSARAAGETMRGRPVTEQSIASMSGRDRCRAG